MVGKFGASRCDGMTYTPVIFTVVGDTGEIFRSSAEKFSGVCMGYSLDTGEILRGSSRKSQQVSSCVWLNMWEIPTGGGLIASDFLLCISRQLTYFD